MTCSTESSYIKHFTAFQIQKNCVLTTRFDFFSEVCKMNSTFDMDNSSINWENQSASVLNSDWCLKCAELDYCTCIEDPSDAVEAIQEVPYLRVTLATYFVCIGFGAIGNLITLFTMATADRKNKTGTNIFLISLTVRAITILKAI